MGSTLELETKKLFDSYYENHTYPIVSNEIVGKIIEAKSYDSFNWIIEDTYNQYIQYLKLVDSLDERTLKQYLKALNDADTINNQILEGEDSFLMSFAANVNKKHALNTLLKIDELNGNEIKNIHKLLLKGTTSEDLATGQYRKTNTKFVGSFQNGKRDIHFLPLHTKDIESAMGEFLDYYNDKTDNIEDLFIKPIKVHGIIAALQVFNDGNTRLGRLLQNAKLYKQTNFLLSKNYENPTLYITRSYKPCRYDYRERIENLAIEPNEDIIMDWIKWNLYKAQEEINQNTHRIKKIIR